MITKILSEISESSEFAEQVVNFKFLHLAQ